MHPFHHPLKKRIYVRVPEEVYDGLADYCGRHGFAAVRDLTGALEV